MTRLHRAFLNSFRFIAAQGQPRVIYSKNATQCRVANQSLSQLWNKLVVNPQECTCYANLGVNWRFITEYASWQGG